MTAQLLEEVDKIDIRGVVTPPPELSTILLKVSAAAEGKYFLELSPGEARVLLNFIEAF